VAQIDQISGYGDKKCQKSWQVHIIPDCPLLDTRNTFNSDYLIEII
jgi:hypothetical protein